MSWSMQATLPRLTYSTERGGCASSHARQARSGPYRRTKWRYCSAAVLAVVSLCSGPTAKVGLDSSASILPSSDASMASNVLTTTPDAESRIASATRAMKAAQRLRLAAVDADQVSHPERLQLRHRLIQPLACRG
ncbi:hypothetical protein EE612_038128 [Oryza sativa]|nr:hypothetical protein EE612_038128 [Oryza sativa]